MPGSVATVEVFQSATHAARTSTAHDTSHLSFSTTSGLQTWMAEHVRAVRAWYWYAFAAEVFAACALVRVEWGLADSRLFSFP